MSDSSFSVVYSTAPDQETAQAIAEVLVQERLVACANLLPKVTSVYRWEEKVETDEEVVLIFKTRSELVQEVFERVKTLHPYEVPCLTSWPLTAGSIDYFNWIQHETER